MPKADHAPIYTRLYFQVVTGIIIGVLLGFFWPETGAAMRPLGDGFIKLIRMIIAPIIFGTVVVGIAKMGDMKDVGRIGIKALVYFEVVSTLALVIGLVVVNVVQPGVGINADPATLDANAVEAYATTAEAPEHGRVPAQHHSRPRSSMRSRKGEILQVLLFSVLFGLALLHMGEKGTRLIDVPRSVHARPVRRRGDDHAAGADRRVRRDGVHDRPVTASARCSRSGS